MPRIAAPPASIPLTVLKQIDADRDRRLHRRQWSGVLEDAQRGHDDAVGVLRRW